MKKYNPQKIEKKWQKIWRQKKIYQPNLKQAKRPFYNLMMFPYPSAEGLHVGNMYAFTGADIYGRMKRMQGYDVFEPIGLDGFGIHSENYALKIGAHPMKQAKVSEKRFYKQLEQIGNGFAWEEKLETYDPQYYKWTQWIFVQMFKKGLAYRKKQAVNWCPGCKTVLADEQVIAGKCERCSNLIEKRELEQWFFRITNYAERLLQNLGKIDWTEKVKTAQRNWIGKSEGAEIGFKIQNSKFKIKVFTTRPDTLFGVTYLVLGPEHPLLKNNELGIKNYEEVKKYIAKSKNKSEAERIEEKREKTGVELKGVKAINPANKEEIPVFVADYVLGNVGTGAIMAVPAHDQRDFEFARKFKLPIKMVICPNYPASICPVLNEAYEGDGYLVDSGKFNGMKSEEAKWKINEFVGGEKKTHYRLRDWLISRQRYWGPPIPLIFCENCKKLLENSKLEIRNSKLSRGELENPGWFAVPESDLPVKLPFVKDFRPTGKDESPLASVKDFYEVKCPNCGGKARRETDVSDTFLDSAWYYLRYPSVNFKNSELKIKNLKLKIPWNQKITQKWLPVDLYTGGTEHAVLHLLYVRFLAMVFYDWGFIDFEEPFPKFRAHGLLIKEGAKMSKSKGNIVNPDVYIKEFGADALRIYLMFLAPFEQGGDFRDAGMMGVVRFLERTWKLFFNIKKAIRPKINSSIKITSDQKLERLIHRTIKKVTEDIENLHYNTAISALMILLNEFEKNKELGIKNYEIFLKLLAPFAPHLTEELWFQLQTAYHRQINSRTIRLKHLKLNSIHKSAWPKFNPRLAVEETIALIIQINGRMRDQIEIERGTGQNKVEQLALSRERVKIHLKGQKPRKIIFVPDRLINFVLQ